MCRAKADKNYPGGRRCPSHAKLRISVIDKKLEAIEVELIAGRNDYENALNKVVQESIAAHLKRLAESKTTLTRERKENEQAIQMSNATIEQMRKHAQSMPDGDKKDRLLAKADNLENKLEKKRADFRQSFLKQTALMDAMRDSGIPEHEREALLESIQSDTGSSNLRSYNNYVDSLYKAEDALYMMKSEYESTGTQIMHDKSLSENERTEKLAALESRWEPVIKNQKERVQEIKFNTYQTVRGLNDFNLEIKAEIKSRKRKIKEREDAGDVRGAQILRRRLVEYSGNREAYRKALEQSRNVRLSDRKLRNSVIPRIKQIMADNHASERDTQKVLEAYKNPVGYLQEKRQTDYWDEKVTVLLHLTGEEAKAYGGIDRETAATYAVRPPVLPEGKTLSEVHSEFVRHSNGGAHRQTTVQGVKRANYKHTRLRRRDVAVIDGYANALGTTRSSYLRAQLLTGNPFALPNDRSATARKNMHKKAKEFLISRRDSGYESLISA